MNKKILVSLISFSAIAMFALYGIGNPFSDQNTLHRLDQVKQVTLMYPINVAASEGKCSSLCVEIPLDIFRVLPQPEHSSLNEFILKQDADDYQWSEIITIMPMIGLRISAVDWRNGLCARIASTSSNVCIIEENEEDFGTYKKASFIMTYTDTDSYYAQDPKDGSIRKIEKNRRELMVSRHYSGPYDAVNMQYTIALVNGITEQDALKKIKAFEQNNIKLLTH